MSNEALYSFMRCFIKETTAIVLGQEKDYLIETRLAPVAKEMGFSSVTSLIQEFKIKPNLQLKNRIIDEITTHETFFFRDIHPFTLLKEHVFPNIIQRKQQLKNITIWCAAASSGQEPYTIAMILNDFATQLADWKVNFVATDISEKMLDKAKRGVYSQIEVNRGLPLVYLLKNFKKNGADWHLKEEIKSMVQFEKTNLMDPWSFNNVDLIFMRNVLIYFDVETKQDILERVHSSLNPNGFLFLGGSETLLGVSCKFKRVQISTYSGCYQTDK
jgi:chemotaxis protein methyltransferase CheR